MTTESNPNDEKKTEETTLSQYLHAQFETLLDHQVPIDKKIEFTSAMNDFLLRGTTDTTDENSEEYRNPTDMFSPLITDTHISILPSTPANRPKINPKDAVDIMSGIRLPPIEWQMHLRKGYSILLWVRLHTPTKPRVKPSKSEKDASSSLTEESQILYRFATSSSTIAHGIQATMYKNNDFIPSSDDDSKTVESHLPCILRFQTLFPPSPQNTIEKTNHSNNTYTNSLTLPVLIPRGRWTLIGVQHSFPYLKKPTLSVNIDGIEVGKGELSYPTIGGEIGGDGMMNDNSIMCNIPSDDKRIFHSRGGSSLLDVEKIDVAGFGLYKESIPSLIQGIICENGPCYAADGVIPVVPPVAQNRDAIILSGDVHLHDKKVTNVGPFGIGANQRPSQSSNVRSIGTPLTTGVMLSSDGHYQGEILLQKLLSKLVLGFNASKSFQASHDRVVIPVTFGSSVGNTADIPKVGIAQPKDPYADSPNRKDDTQKWGKTKTHDHSHDEQYARCIGTVSIFSTSMQYIKQEKLVKNQLVILSIPKFHIQTSVDGGTNENICPNFLSTYTNVNTFAYIFQAFRLALPPPGYPHNLQMEYYRNSFDHLYTLVVYKNGALAAQLIQLMASNILLGGRMREEIIQAGYIHVLAVLLRKVLLRAIRLGMYDSKVMNSSHSGRLWQRLGSREAPYDDLKDSNSTQHSAPSHIPLYIINSCCAIISATCGPVQNDSKRWKRHELSFHIRRASDLSLTSIFGFALDFDLFGGDPNACAAILLEVVNRYCSAGVHLLKSNEMTEKFDSGYGRLLRSEVSVEYLLDLIRLRFGEIIMLSSSHDKSVRDAYQSIAVSLSRILYTVLKYSLSSSKSPLLGEVDIRACVHALSDCPLGSVGFHIIITSIRDILTYCELFPNNFNSMILSNVPKIVQNEAAFRLKKVKSEIASKLARHLIKSQFHGVICPVLLSRTVSDSRADSNDQISPSKQNLEHISTELSGKTEVIVSIYHWQHHWRLLLHIFTWLCSVSGAEGERAAESTGALLLHSAQTGTLHRCLSTGDWYGIIPILVPQLSTESSAVNPGSFYDESRPTIEPHIFDMSNRLKVVIYLLSGLTACILSNDPNGNVAIEKGSIEVLITITRTIKEILFYLISAKGEDYIGFTAIESTRRSQLLSSSEKTDVKVALHVVSHFITSIALLENKIVCLLNGLHTNDATALHENDDWKHKLSELEELLEADSTDDWHLLNDHKTAALSPEEQVSNLSGVQKDLLSTTGVIVSRAMIVGGGEASTLVWRSILATIESVSSYAFGLKGKIKVDLLCRIVATVLEYVLQDRVSDDNPWKSIEICAATARLLDLVEEKKLMNVSDEMITHKKKIVSSDQVRLLFVLLKCLESGRENTGWCQLELPKPPSRRESREETRDAQLIINNMDTIKDHQALINLLRDPKICEIKSRVNRWNVQYELDGWEEDIHCLPLRDKPRGFSPSDSASSSKMLLPILQPAFRVVLNALENIPGGTTVLKNKEQLSLVSLVVPELRATITAALVGLAFSNARDMSLYILSKLRRCIIIKDQEGDESALNSFRSVFLTTVEEIRNRYIGERTKREHASKYAYKDDASDIMNYQHSANSLHEAANASEVEGLLIGDDAFQPLKREAEDFLIFPHDSTDLEGSVSNSKRSSMGWSNYKGFGVALEHCFNFIEQKHENSVIELQSEKAISILAKYIDSWESYQALDDEESELVDLFDAAISMDAFSSLSACFPNATDSMTAFIDISSSEKSRVNEIRTSLLPAQRFNRISFAETVCWSHFQGVACDNFTNEEDIFERCFADGSRDYGSRLVTVPVHPQFSRFIPRQLDHSVSENTVQDKENEIEASSLPRDSSKDLDFDHLNDLLQKSSVKIVDITKKPLSNEQSHDEEEDNLVSKSSADETEKDQLLEDVTYDEEDSGLFLGFPNHEDDTGITNELTNSKKDREENDEQDIPDRMPETSVQEQVDIDFDFSLSSFANPPNFSSMFLRGQGGPSMCLGGLDGVTDMSFENCLHIKADGSRRATIHLRDTFLFLQYEDKSGLYDGELLAVEELKKKLVMNDDCSKTESSQYDQMIKHYQKLGSMRSKCIRLNISELSHVYLRRFRLRDSALELFFIPSGGTCHDGPGLSSALSSVLLDFGPGRNGNETRDKAANEIMSRAPMSTVKQWPERSASFLHEHLKNLTIGWVKGRVTNFDYLLALNCLSGRSFNDLCQYPVFPWVLSNYHSSEIPNLNDRSNFRDLSKPMGALNAERLQDFLERFKTFDDPVIPPFMYGSHYSTSAGVVLHFLVRLHPFASLHRQLQGGHFDVADRLFSSVSRTWDMCTGHSAAEVKELTPEWYCNPAFLRNNNSFKLGTSQDGEIIGDVQLPQWAKGSPEIFIEVMRSALESDICTSMLPDWVDLIFGRKQQGPEAVQSNNVFFYLTYYGSCDVASIEDDDLRKATELQIAHFGQCPMQLFWRPHVHKLPILDPRRRQSLSDLLGVYDLDVGSNGFKPDRQMPFQHAPISHWVHLAASPPGPHAPLVATRLVFPDRCIAVDAHGIVHFFRWIWRADMEATEKEHMEEPHNLFTDKGYFVAQRELPNFRRVPRLRHASKIFKTNNAVAISKCLFSNRLLVVSDGDGFGGLSYQLVDPTKTNIQGEVYVSHVHSRRIRAIQMDSIGSAAGVGGAGGELAIVGSEDGTSSIWRFIINDSCCLPLRPRHRMGGHRGNRIVSVAINASLNICATVSSKRCCIFNTSNGHMIRSIFPPSEDTTGIFPSVASSSSINCETRFADTTAICITSSAHIILVCESEFTSSESGISQRKMITLELFTLEGVHLGSKALESWRGVPNKITATFDGRCIFVCCNRGISVHLVSAIKPLCFVDEWHLGVSDDTSSNEDNISLGAHDIDFGPSPSRPIIVCAGLSSGNLRLHALKGISEWSEEYKKGSVNEAVNSVIGTVKGTGSKVAGIVKGTGSRIIGFGKDIGKESLSEVKNKGKGFFGEVFGKAMMNP